MSADVIAGLALLGVGVGVLGTLVGAGGGFLLTPVLLIVYPNESAQTLTSISLAAVCANSTSGTIAYLRQRRVDIRSGIVFGVATLPGAIAGALLVGYVPRRAFDAIMAFVLAAVAVWLSVYRRWEFHQTRGGSSARHRRRDRPRVAVRRSGRPGDRLQPLCRLSLELPRDRRWCLPRPDSRHRTRVPDSHRHGHIPLRARPDERRRPSPPTSHRARTASATAFGGRSSLRSASRSEPRSARDSRSAPRASRSSGCSLRVSPSRRCGLR